MSEPYQDTLGLWEMNDDELEAELQRQLDGLDSEDDQDVKEEERQLMQTGTNNKIVTAEEEGEGTEVDENKSLTANISPAPDSAWSQLMATMNADTNHWDQYEHILNGWIMKTRNFQISEKQIYFRLFKFTKNI